MGKRKTRKRSRRSKRGSGNDCIWYGENNKGVKPNMFGIGGKPARDIDEMKDESACGGKFEELPTIPPQEATVVGVVGKLKNMAEVHPKLSKLPPIMKDKTIKLFKDVKTTLSVKPKTFNVYVVAYEKKCASLGERYQLYTIKGCNIAKKSPDGVYEVTKKGETSMRFTENEKNNTLDMVWGMTRRNGIPETSIMLEEVVGTQRMNTVMGGKKKRRRRTKKKSRKKRKRTKKRRRRRR